MKQSPTHRVFVQRFEVNTATHETPQNVNATYCIQTSIEEPESGPPRSIINALDLKHDARKWIASVSQCIASNRMANSAAWQLAEDLEAIAASIKAASFDVIRLNDHSVIDDPS